MCELQGLDASFWIRFRRPTVTWLPGADAGVVAPHVEIAGQRVRAGGEEDLPVHRVAFLAELGRQRREAEGHGEEQGNSDAGRGEAQGEKGPLLAERQLAGQFAEPRREPSPPAPGRLPAAARGQQQQQACLDVCIYIYI